MWFKMFHGSQLKIPGLEVKLMSAIDFFFIVKQNSNRSNLVVNKLKILMRGMRLESRTKIQKINLRNISGIW